MGSSCAGGRIHRVHPTIEPTGAKSGISHRRSRLRLEVVVVVVVVAAAARPLLVDDARVVGSCGAVAVVMLVT